MHPRIDTTELNKRINLFILAGQDTKLKKKTSTEYAGPCPFCGGRDRFSVMTNGKKWICRNCTEGKWTDGISYAMRRSNTDFMGVAREYLGNEAPQIDPAVAAERVRNDQAEQEQRAAYRRTKLAEFSKQELTTELHERMAAEQRQQWRTWGIPDSWQDYLELGYTPDKPFNDGGETLQHSPAYTIPYFHNTTVGKELITIQYRLVNAPNPADRYRFEYGLGTTYYMTMPTEPISDIVIICEGAKKAAVMRICSGVNKSATILGVPSKSDTGGIVEAVKDCGLVYILLDPDGEAQARKLATRIGDNARIVTLHAKVDDLILQYGMGKEDFRQAFKWAERIA